MKKFAWLLCGLMIISFSGCQEVSDQAGKFKDDTTKALGNASQQLEDTKKLQPDERALKAYNCNNKQSLKKRHKEGTAKRDPDYNNKIKKRHG